MARPGKPAEPAVPEAAHATRRKQVIDLLTRDALTFEELRRELRVAKGTLEEDLRHVARSLRHEGRKLRVTPSYCADCDFVFRGRAEHHFHRPGRCPSCRGERTREAVLRIDPAERHAGAAVSETPDT